ncbi:hypothetical protein [Ruminococcus sp. HUN007]|uniref:hypothetical protein n=1 Tax=Ruminococcus sp. HUN007 TaxID=1514668 RepID=UPI0005D191D4|nr:hypothetical protein [Ruminococcus sp. HUN007]
MEILKCEQCGGELKRIRTRHEWFCSFCNSRYSDEPSETRKPCAKYYGLNEEVFSVECDLSKVMKKENGSGCIKSIVHCMDICENSSEIEKYLSAKCKIPDDISMKGLREDQIANALPRINEVMEPGERVIVYGNKGIFSKGKEYFVITDKRSIFVEKKNISQVLHTDIDSLKIADCGNCNLNGDYSKGIVNLDGTGTFQGALLALICVLSFEADMERAKIRLV